MARIPKVSCNKILKLETEEKREWHLLVQSLFLHYCLWLLPLGYMKDQVYKDSSEG